MQPDQKKKEKADSIKGDNSMCLKENPGGKKGEVEGGKKGAAVEPEREGGLEVLPSLRPKRRNQGEKRIMPGRAFVLTAEERGREPYLAGGGSSLTPKKVT